MELTDTNSLATVGRGGWCILTSDGTRNRKEMRRLGAFVIILTLPLFVPGCRERPCTPQQHHEVMKSIREVEGYDFRNLAYLPPPEYKPLGLFDSNVKLRRMSEGEYLRRYIRQIKRICKFHDVSYGAFNRAHAEYGLLKLTYTEEVKTLIKTSYYRDEVYQDKNATLIRKVDLTDDLGASPNLLIVVDE